MSRQRSASGGPTTLATGVESDLLATYVSNPGSLSEQQIESLREKISRDPELAHSIAMLKEVGRADGDASDELTASELEADWVKVRGRLRDPARGEPRFRIAAGFALAALGLAAVWALVQWPSGSPVAIDLYAESPTRRALDPDGPAPQVGLVEQGTPAVVFVLNALVPPAYDTYRTETYLLGDPDRLIAEAVIETREPDGTWRVDAPTGNLEIGRYRIRLLGTGADGGEDVLTSFLFRVAMPESSG